MEPWMMDLATAAEAVHGSVVGANVRFARVTTDSRAVEPGDLFVALAGERHDGHAFVASAFGHGAAAAIVARNRGAFPGPVVAVADPLVALGRLSAEWRARFTLSLALVVGSNGKTTVKEMTASILRAAFGLEATLATSGNFNNAIGLPLTLLRLRAGHRAAVVELGMNHRGETRELAAIARPTIVAVNNAQREHQEFMASIAEVAAEHADAVASLPVGGIAVLNADDASCASWRAAAVRAHASVTTFALHSPADVTATVEPSAAGSELALRTPAGTARARLSAPGEPMARNALAATAIALAAGAPLDAVTCGLEAFRPVAGRLSTIRASSGAMVIDDSYNANPDSVRAAIDVLARAEGRRWLVLGDMGEVGAEGPAYHREVGGYARERGIDRLDAVGAQVQEAVDAFGANARRHDDVDALIAAVVPEARGGTTMLVKGSRFMRMERVVAALTGRRDGGGGH
ncbi:MAG: UDP-N-acetylmuramoyl-tripeptide--D-alanyl-D-alanine ligase [Betaproteobacteria bacterium]